MATIKPNTPLEPVQDEASLRQERQEIIEEAQLTSTQFGVNRLDLDLGEDTLPD